MKGGWNRKLLSVDLTKKTIITKKCDATLLRKYIGGMGVGLKIVYDEVCQGTDAFDESNPLVFVTGPMTGTAAISSGAYGVVTKSPLSNNIAMGSANGFFGMRLKQAGYDFIIIRGKSEKPVYLFIDDGKAELRDASKVWGLNADDTEAKLKEIVGAKDASVSCIGVAGENQVRYAAIASDNGHIASSGGIGAVMGSKKLKAVVAHGTMKVPVADPETLSDVVTEWRQYIKKSQIAQGLTAFGTAGSLSYLYAASDLPIKNLSTNIFPEHENLNGMAIRNNFKTKVKPCYRCPINHVHSIEFTEGPHEGMVMEEPEYEGCAGLGSNIGVGKTDEMLYLNYLCDNYVIDYKTFSFVISLCMECYEKGLLSKEQLNGIDLTWGNAEGVEKLIDMISRREGIGNILAENIKTIAEYIGGDAPNMAVHIKGAGIHLHDIRSLWGFGLSHVISNYSSTMEGSSVEFGPETDLGYDTPLNPHSMEGQAVSIRKKGRKEQFCDCAMLCQYPVGHAETPMVLLIKAMNAITGDDYTVDEIWECMDRIRTLARAFAIRQGLTAADDWPSERLLEPFKNGPLAGLSWTPHLKQAIRDYYREMGWDEETSIPLKKTLQDLDLDYVIDDIWQ